jgi:WhiB family redox-sensing transcriptional regulator
MDDERDESWKLHAACLGLDPSLWFPEDNTTISRENTAAALEICATCSVQTECREFGWRELFGTWGGMTQRERLLARRGEFRRDKAWHVALALVSDQESVPPSRYDEGITDPDERQIS